MQMERETLRLFDWVKARAECSLPHLFGVLGEVVDSDVKAIQKIKPDMKFTFSKPTATKVIVGKTWDAGGFSSAESIVFELVDAGIAVKQGPTEKRLLIARPTLDLDGECRLAIDGERDGLELWQVSRRALEALFFG
jgi:hypothetical protein